MQRQQMLTLKVEGWSLEFGADVPKRESRSAVIWALTNLFADNHKIVARWEISKQTKHLTKQSSSNSQNHLHEPAGKGFKRGVRLIGSISSSSSIYESGALTRSWKHDIMNNTSRILKFNKTYWEFLQLKEEVPRLIQK